FFKNATCSPFGSVKVWMLGRLIAGLSGPAETAETSPRTKIEPRSLRKNRLMRAGHYPNSDAAPGLTVAVRSPLAELSRLTETPTRAKVWSLTKHMWCFRVGARAWHECKLPRRRGGA